MYFIELWKAVLTLLLRRPASSVVVEFGGALWLVGLARQFLQCGVEFYISFRLLSLQVDKQSTASSRQAIAGRRRLVSETSLPAAIGFRNQSGRLVWKPVRPTGLETSGRLVTGFRETIFLEECEKIGNNRAEMKELTENIRKVSVKAEDDIEAALLNVHHYQKLVQALQRVVEDIEELMQTTRNTNHHLVNNLTVGGPSQPITSNVVEDNAMVGHSEELIKGSRYRFRHSIRLGGSRWLSIKVSVSAFHLIISSEECRSIFCFNMALNCDREWYLRADSFKKLRVLDLSKINFRNGMPADITDLIFLRYLAIASCKVLNCIPLWKNWNLQSLIVTEDDNGARRLPPGIWELPQLRHLELYHQISIDRPKVIQEDLQTLYWLSTSECTTEVFLRIPNVKELGIIAGEEALPLQGLNNLCCLSHLEKLKVQGSYHPLHLHPQATIYPQNLKELTFVRTLIPWEDMNCISMLPNLEVLKLRNFACVGEDWELIEEGGFPQLKVLLISLTNLKEWKAHVDTPFPKLERLLLRNCFELKEMPEWMEDAITLRLIKLEYCYASLVRSAQRIKDEQFDNYGNMLDVIGSNTDELDKDHATEEEDSNEQTYEGECVRHGLISLWFEAKRLRIGWGDDLNWIWTRDSDFGCEVAKLVKASWFEIGLNLNLRCLSKMTCYSAYLVFKLGDSGEFRDVKTALAAVRYEKDKAIYGGYRLAGVRNEKDIYGWMLGENRHSQVFLAKKKSYGDCGRFPHSRFDGWREIKIGNFYVSSGNEGKIELQLWHVSDQYWKSGFIVRGIEVRPVNEGQES
nr:putative late blight resistance protein homolog R1B-17 [Ipomoea batatas]